MLSRNKSMSSPHVSIHQNKISKSKFTQRCCRFGIQPKMSILINLLRALASALILVPQLNDLKMYQSLLWYVDRAKTNSFQNLYKNWVEKFFFFCQTALGPNLITKFRIFLQKSIQFIKFYPKQIKLPILIDQFGDMFWKAESFNCMRVVFESRLFNDQ